MGSKMTLGGVPRARATGRKTPAYSKKRIREQRMKDPNYSPPKRARNTEERG